jgi:hypothetical protein
MQFKSYELVLDFPFSIFILLWTEIQATEILEKTGGSEGSSGQEDG